MVYPVSNLGSKEDPADASDGGLPCQPEDGEKVHGRDGHLPDLPQGQPVEAEFQGSHRAVSAAEFRGALPESGLVHRHHLREAEPPAHVPDRDHRLVQPEDRGLEAVGHTVYQGRPGRRPGSGRNPWNPGDHQFRPGKPVYQRRVQGVAEGTPYPPKHGRQKTLGGQHHDRAVVPQPEDGEAICRRIRDGTGTESLHRGLHQPVQHRPPPHGAGLRNSGRCVCRELFRLRLSLTPTDALKTSSTVPLTTGPDRAVFRPMGQPRASLGLAWRTA